MKAKTKKIVTGAVALSLVMVMAVGGTMAYLTKQTEKRANNFTFASEGLNANLIEPDWDGVIDYEYDESSDITPIYDYIANPDYDESKDPNPETNPNKLPVYGYKGGDKLKPITDKTTLETLKNDDDETNDPDRPRMDSTDDTYNPTYGDEDAQNMIPGQVALKNPIITNTGSITDEWVATKITFVYAEGTDNAGEKLSLQDMKSVTNAIEISYDADATTGTTWDRATGTSSDIEQIFYYKNILKKDSNATDVGEYGESTTPIFTQVKVKQDASNEDLKKLEDIGGFAIYIEGFAVQSDIMEDFNAETLSKYVKFASDNDTSNKSVAKPGIIKAD